MYEWLYKVGAKGDITNTDFYGWTPMYVACKNGHLSICKWLILNGILTDGEHKNAKYTFLKLFSAIACLLTINEIMQIIDKKIIFFIVLL